MSKPDGGPAFPKHWRLHDDPGMSLRDHFAGVALSGMVSHPDMCPSTVFGVAQEAYRYADAMIAERGRLDAGHLPDCPTQNGLADCDCRRDEP